MDRRESEALRWVNKHLVDAGLAPIERFPRSKRGDWTQTPVARIFSRLLEVSSSRTPGEASFSCTDVTFRYWHALKLSEGFWPPMVIAFNRGFAAGEYPHLLA